MRAVFDIEGDGLLDDVSVIHCLVIQDVDTSEVYSYRHDDILDGLKKLKEATTLIGHNIISYDIPTIKKLYPWFKTSAKIIDTLNLSRLIHTNLLEDDFKHGKIDKKLFGSHSLKAWGKRLDRHKGEFEGPWNQWSKEMQSYCEQDVFVNLRLFQFFEKQNYSQRAIDLEMDFQEIITKQEQKGVYFDSDLASKYYHQLNTELEATKSLLVKEFPGFTDVEIFIPKRNNRTKGYIAGVPFPKTKFTKFNPGSRNQCLRLLKDKYEWIPEQKTEKGNPKLDEEVLSSLEFPEAKLLSRFYEIKKITGRIYDGKTAWLKLCKNGVISARMITNGAVTGRATHTGVSNIPRVTSYFGKECRSLFHAGEGWMVGADASGLELRILAHYLSKYDEGRYIRIVTTGDVHTQNQEDAGLPNRDNAKTFIYAFVYGAGDAKIGSIVRPEGNETERKHTGKKIKKEFFRKNPAIAKLIEDVKRASERGYLKGLDGRLLHIRSEHLALNTLLQSAGAIVMKEAAVIADRLIKESGIDAHQCIHYHDEMQYIVTNKDECEKVGDILVSSIKKSGESLNLKCPLDAEYKIGKNWAETH